ncbi:SagB/ThcOx family dehydrogenase [Cystobacter fuscus]|uniref:SagB/ThcOx family dehydrogenase n=1 Tax=Cystobacter fuscus TaxID=43 RepID=UPI002B29E6DE|nr:SagB/ThcOx family dehydrogenase [Cystobacter fuscus]
MRRRTQPLLEQRQQALRRREPFLGSVFHENSKFTPQARHELGRRISQLQDERLLRRVSSSYKSHPGCPQVELPRAALHLERELQEIIVGRRSTREFDPARSVTLQELANLLQLSYGITGSLELDEGVTQYLRAIPSAGALYPLELYLVVQRVEGLAPGLYHYRVARHALEVLEVADQAERMPRMEREWGMGSPSAFHVVISGVFERTMFKYHERGYRFVLIEAGMLGQNLTLLAECQDIRSCMAGGWGDDELNQLFGLDGGAESSLLTLCFGRAPRGGP